MSSQGDFHDSVTAVKIFYFVYGVLKNFLPYVTYNAWRRRNVVRSPVN